MSLFKRKTPVVYVDPLVAAGEKVTEAIAIFDDAAEALDQAVHEYEAVEQIALDEAERCKARAIDANVGKAKARRVRDRLNALTGE